MNKILAAIIFLPLLLLVSCSLESDLEKVGGKHPDQTIYGFTLVESKSGKEEWQLVAEKADIYQKSNRTELFQPRMKFYGDEGEIRSTLRADEGTANTSNNAISMRGNVVIHSEEKKTTLTTDNIRWDPDKKKVLSDDFVKQESEEAIVTGYGLEVDTELDSIIIKKDVKVIKKEGEL